MNYITNLLLSAAPFYVCCLYTLKLLPEIRKQSIDRTIFFYFMLNSSIMYLTDLFFSDFNILKDNLSAIPFIDVIRTLTMLACYPIWYLYIVSLTGKISKRTTLLFIPAILLTTLMAVCYLSIPKENLTEVISSLFIGVEDVSDSTIIERANLLVILFTTNLWVLFFLIFTILILGYRRLKIYIRTLKEYYSNIKNKSIKDIEIILCLFILKSAKALIGYSITSFTDWDISNFSALWMLANAAILFYFGYIALSMNFSFQDICKENATNIKSTNEQENENSETNFISKLDEIMQKEKLYLSPDLKIGDLAIRFNTNVVYLQGIIKLSGIEDETFLSYVNKYRIKHCLELMNNDKEGCHSIMEIAESSGFNSRSTFYRVFKKEIGMTPMEYLKSTT